MLEKVVKDNLDGKTLFPSSHHFYVTWQQIVHSWQRQLTVCEIFLMVATDVSGAQVLPSIINVCNSSW